MSFADAVKTCLTKYADFNGRASRPEYWWFLLAVVASYLVAFMIGLASGAEDAATLLVIVILLGSVLPFLAAAIRRLHDTGKSGWWYLIGMIPYVGGMVLLVMLGQEGDPGSNRYGPPPGQQGGVGGWSDLPLAPVPPPPPLELAQTGPSSGSGQGRAVTYSMGATAMIRDGGRVSVDELEDGATWTTDDGGVVKPLSPDRRLVRARITAGVDAGTVTVGTIVYSFALQLSSGAVVEPLEESHRETDLLEREDDLIGPGEEIWGDIWFDVGPGELRAVTFESDAFDAYDDGVDPEAPSAPIVAWEPAAS